MSKKKIEVDVATISASSLSGSLGALSNYIGENIQRYGKDARLVWEPNFRYSQYDTGDSPSYIMKIEREETDEEYKTRVEQEENLAKKREIREREEFERLSKKFNKDIDA